MKKHLFIIISLCIFATMASCKHEVEPDNLIDTATMTSIMSEYYLIESYDYIIASRHPDSLDYQPKAAKDSLLRKYKITQADYDSSLAYYIRHPKVFEALFDRVIMRLSSLNEAQPPANRD